MRAGQYSDDGGAGRGGGRCQYHGTDIALTPYAMVRRFPGDFAGPGGTCGVGQNHETHSADADA